MKNSLECLHTFLVITVQYYVVREKWALNLRLGYKNYIRLYAVVADNAD